MESLTTAISMKLRARMLEGYYNCCERDRGRRSLQCRTAPPHAGAYGRRALRRLRMLWPTRRPRLVLEIDAGERLPVGVADMKHRRSSFGSGSSTDQRGGKRCAIVTAFAVAQHAARLARFVDARGGERASTMRGTLLVKQKDALPPGNSPTPEWAANGTIHSLSALAPVSIIASADHAPPMKPAGHHYCRNSRGLARWPMEGGGFGLIGDLLVV